MLEALEINLAGAKESVVVSTSTLTGNKWGGMSCQRSEWVRSWVGHTHTLHARGLKLSTYHDGWCGSLWFPQVKFLFSTTLSRHLHGGKRRAVPVLAAHVLHWVSACGEVKIGLSVCNKSRLSVKCEQSQDQSVWHNHSLPCGVALNLYSFARCGHGVIQLSVEPLYPRTRV